MLNTEKLNRKKKESKDGGGNDEVLGYLKAIVAKQQEQEERLEELESGKGKEMAQLRLVNLLYDTDDKHLPGLTRLPLRAVKPFAIAMMLDKVTSPEVREGKVSLQQVFYTNYFMLMRSVGGDAFKQGVGLAGEQAASEGEVQGAEFRLGAE